MRVLILGVVLLIVGCADPQASPPQNGGQLEKKAVREWLHKIPLVQVFGYAVGQDPVKAQQDLKFDVDKWLDEGRKNPGTTAVLQRMLQENDPDANLPAAAFVLGKLGARESVPVLIACLDRDDIDLQRKAMEALGRIGDRRAVNVLTARLTLLLYCDVNTHGPLMFALASIGDDESERMLELAGNSMDVDLAETAREALAELRRKRESSQRP